MDNNDSDFVDIALVRPFEIDGAQIKVLRMREPTVADQLAQDEYKGSNAAKEIFTLANLCQIAPDDIKRLKMRDYRKVQKAYLDFID